MTPTEKEYTIQETINQRFRTRFKDPETDNTPRAALETCDLHLTGLQPLMFVDPKKNPVEKITWKDPIDKLDNLRQYEPISWLAISIISFVFFLVIWYRGV